jgi:hypothetical protein
MSPHLSVKRTHSYSRRRGQGSPRHVGSTGCSRSRVDRSEQRGRGSCRARKEVELGRCRRLLAPPPWRRRRRPRTPCPSAPRCAPLRLSTFASISRSAGPTPPNLVGFDLFLFVLSCLGCSAAAGSGDGPGHRYRLRRRDPQQAGTAEARNPIRAPRVHQGECPR